jgi:hypothetical protein
MATFGHKIPSTAEPVASSSEPQRESPRASTASEKPTLPTKRDRRELLVLAALGATFGFLTGWGLWTEIHFDSIEFALFVIPLALAAYILYDPIGELINRGDKEGSIEHPERRGVAAFSTGALALLAVAGFDHSLGSALGDALGKLANELIQTKLEAFVTLGTDLERLANRAHDMGAFWIVLFFLIIVGVSSLLVTLVWAHGARRDPLRSMHWGAFVGLGLGAVGAIGLASYLVHRNLFDYWPSWILAGLVVFWFFVPGLLGGWAIHKLDHGSSPTHDISWYLGISSAIYAIVLLASAKWFQHYFSNYKDSISGLIWLPVCALLFQNLGWALAPYSRRKICDGPLCPWRAAISQPSPEKQDPQERPAGVVVPIRDGGSSLSADTHARRTSASQSREMLLKPKGDRLWGTALLVLALIVAAPAYLLGTLRNDRSIAGNVEGSLVQDSGLRTKGLTVHSAGRVVTISGVVDNESEHAAAVQRALSVRGVKQLIDQIQIAQIQVAPPAPPTPAVVTPVPPPAPAINATVSITVPQGRGKAGTAGPQKQSVTPKAADTQKHGFFHLPKKDNLVNPPHGTQTQAVAPKTADPQKKGFFHFLKKDKNNNNNNKQQPKPNNAPSH